MSRKKIASILQKYIPAASVETCVSWIMQKNIHLRITRARSSKFGDYIPLAQGRGHKITVNHDLNQYAFLITFIHEVAHLHAYVKYKHNHEPHGREWKNEFKILLSDFMLMGIFPEDIKAALSGYIMNPSASSCSDQNLFRALKKYDQREEQVYHVEELPDGATFQLHQSSGKHLFKKGPLLRKRFHCIELNSNKVYFVSPLAEVVIS